ncbi:hypothetical protein MVEN_00664400 [Mycena venus]|uniref:Hydrophobin n=1 Tax=Mycena venus TaxID=2733690 RepID=A0A8H6YQ45_9AGAR|nr:hypothetical protein MVEN_00664400 [Mycena venus]
MIKKLIFTAILAILFMSEGATSQLSTGTPCGGTTDPPCPTGEICCFLGRRELDGRDSPGACRPGHAALHGTVPLVRPEHVTSVMASRLCINASGFNIAHGAMSSPLGPGPVAPKCESPISYVVIFKFTEIGNKALTRLHNAQLIRSVATDSACRGPWGVLSPEDRFCSALDIQVLRDFGISALTSEEEAGGPSTA